MHFDQLRIPGAYSIKFPDSSDDRGRFMKFFQRSTSPEWLRSLDFSEQYVTKSKIGVVRGMHFQVPPHDHDKLVVLISGRAFDVLIDLRVSKTSFKLVEHIPLSTDGVNGVFIPRGVAHGFQALEEDTTLLYKVTSEYAPGSDTGVHPIESSISWPIPISTVSDRDRKLLPLSEYNSPFK